MRHALLLILVLSIFSCQSKKDNASATTAESAPITKTEIPADKAKINALKEVEDKAAALKIQEEERAQEMLAIENERIAKEKAKQKAKKRRAAARAKKEAARAKLATTKPKKISQPVMSDIKPDESDPMITENPIVKNKIVKEEELEKLTEIAFKRNFYTFGEIIEGDTIDFNFSFTNIGDHPLYLKSVKASCGCTYPSYSFLAIAPGEKGEITGMYVSTGKIGPQNPVVNVTSNTYPTLHKLYLDGTVLEKPTVTKEKEAPTTEGKEASTDTLGIGG